MKNIDSIVEFHSLLSLPEPFHPLVSIVKVEDLLFTNDAIWKKFYLNFYTISLKKGIQAKVKYGQNYYDYNKGVMNFTAPKQVKSLAVSETPIVNEQSGMGYVLLLHPDFLNRHPLALTIKTYGFFSYAVNEALHLSEKEQNYIMDMFKKIEQESQHIDSLTQGIILSQIDLLLNYCNRFYQRQFLTRKAVNNDLLTKMEFLLNTFFENEEALQKGLPTVDFLANELGLSQHYLNDMLRSLTGQSTQQHIHQKVIEKAKEYLTTTNLSVAEIAYQLGYEYPQSFNKLFKKKTNSSPLEYRSLFN